MGYLDFKQIPNGGGNPNQEPFDVVLSIDSQNLNNSTATVAPGTVNGIFPANWDQKIPVVLGDPTYGYIFAETNGKTVTKATILFDAAYDPAQEPVNNGLPTTFQYAFCIIKNNIAYRCMGGGSIVAWGETQYIKGVENPSTLQPGQL